MFVPATKDSILAKKIKSAEAQNNQGRTSRIKVVERTGSTVEAKLSRKAPWPTVRCEEKQECFYCTTSKEAKTSCRTPGVGYVIICDLCANEEGRISTYQGETGKNLHVRGKKHLQEFKGGCSSNCMVIHNRTFHPQLKCRPGDAKFNFRVERSGVFKTPLSRQVNEALRIKNSIADQRMNSGSEWRADALPRAAFSAPGLENRRRAGRTGGAGGRREEEEGRPGVGRPGGGKGLRVKNPIAMDIIEDKSLTQQIS